MIRIRALCFSLVAFLGFVGTNQVIVAQTQNYSILHDFGDGSVANDGSSPEIIIQGQDGNLYGSTDLAGGAAYATIYKMTPSGQETVIHQFNDGSVPNDGTEHVSSLIEGNDGNLYGLTFGGGSAGYGTIFKMTTDGQETILHSFRDGTVINDGYLPNSLLQGADGDFYGCTTYGGSSGEGCVFKLTPEGQETIIYNFSPGANGSVPASLVQARDGTLYGVTQSGGAGNSGTAFHLTLDGVITILHNFSDGTVPNDGSNPSLILEANDGNFYGLTRPGFLTRDGGTLFKLTPSGQVTIIHSFGAGTVSWFPCPRRN